jgi:hypothetical protein
MSNQKKMYFCQTFEAIHNKDYSVVKTSKTGLLRPRFFFTMNLLNKRACPVLRRLEASSPRSEPLNIT